MHRQGPYQISFVSAADHIVPALIWMHRLTNEPWIRVQTQNQKCDGYILSFTQADSTKIKRAM